MMEKKATTFSLLAVMLQCTWPNHCTKNIPQHLLGVIHLVYMNRMTDFSTLLPLYAPVHIWMNSPSFPPFAYVVNG